MSTYAGNHHTYTANTFKDVRPLTFDPEPPPHTLRSLAYLSAGWEVVVDSEGDFGLLPSDQAVGQREVNKKGLEGAKFRPLG